MLQVGSQGPIFLRLQEQVWDHMPAFKIGGVAVDHMHPLMLRMHQQKKVSSRNASTCRHADYHGPKERNTRLLKTVPHVEVQHARRRGACFRSLK